MNYDAFIPRLIRASAGSGKTHQLTNRYLQLLAEGIEPEAILATTFTRKAAGEILDRVLERLAKAAADSSEGRELARQIGPGPGASSDYVALLRRMLRGLHRVRIGTLDSFYIALARSFSFELGLPAGWSICEDVDDARMRSEALERLFSHQPDDVWRLLLLLTKGETNRSVHGELERVLQAHYDVFLDSEHSAWENLYVPQAGAETECLDAVNRLRAFDLSQCGDKRIPDARNNDLDKFETEDWMQFVKGGLAAKVLAGDTFYQRKPIPPEVVTLYQTLLQHARSKILRELWDQTRATWDLLERFHGELWTQKQTAGALRFGDVTQKLVQKIEGLYPDAVAYRLDGAVDHLLLDEFQDTSLAQWSVLRPIAEHLTRANSGARRSFFCVGDVKQAIYGWRGGLSEILDSLPCVLGKLESQPLHDSRRSAQPIIATVNQVFQHLDRFQPNDNVRDGIAAWSKRFEKHTTAKGDLPGYACLQTGPSQREDESLDDHRDAHCEFVANKVKELVGQARGRSIGVLCRKNDTLAAMIYQLRKNGVEASEEGGNPLDDSAAVEVMLSLFTLADHPGHSIAYFHLMNSPLKEELKKFGGPSDLSRELRRQLLVGRCSGPKEPYPPGYGPFTQRWAERIAPDCNRRDLSRLQQLVEMAYAFQPRSTLRADDFVTWVRQQRVPDPSGANVRVMTMHGAKGLQFDAVFLPELDAGLLGQEPSFVVRRDPQDLKIKLVCRYAAKEVQALLSDIDRAAFEHDRQQRVEESLSLLYVAMTRAIHAMYLYIPGKRVKEDRDAWYNLLLVTLAPQKRAVHNQTSNGEGSREPPRLLYQNGDANWFTQQMSEPSVWASQPRASIAFKPVDAERRRGMDHVAPSRKEGHARLKLDRLFQPSEGTGTAAGTLYHEWFASIKWLDDGQPTDEALRNVAEKLRATLPPETWRDLDRLVASFQQWLRTPEIHAVLCRPAYAGPQQTGFPAALRSIWTNGMALQDAQLELPFCIRDGTKFWDGRLDRVVWIGNGERTVAADVLDFKTDDIKPGNETALLERVEHYRPQLEAYRHVVTKLANLAPERVAARLVFTVAGKIVDV
jgi:ATP-dependent exoDNAse (exonuclease V) beta subunit